jgi:hypothetical protein
MRNHKYLCSEIGGPRHVSHGIDGVFLGSRPFKCERFAQKTVRFGKVYRSMFGPMCEAAIDGDQHGPQQNSVSDRGNNAL